MLTDYILRKLSQAHYKILEDGTYFGEILGLPGVWASGETLEKCREALREILEEWIILKLKDGEDIPELFLKNTQKAGMVMELTQH